MKLQFKRKLDYIAGSILVAINLFAAKALGFLLRRNHSLNTPPKNILVIKMLGLGSIFLASNALLAVKKKYPKSKLILITGQAIKPGLEPLSLFDEIWEIRDKNFFQLFKSSIQILFKCWENRNTWIVDLEVYSKLTTVFALWTCAINRFGFVLNPVRFRTNMNTHNVFFNQFVNVEENYIRLAGAMGAEVTENFYLPNFPLAHRNEELSYPYIAINNTCSDLSLERKLPDNLLAQICKRILAETSYKIAFVGAPSDTATIDSFIQNSFDENQKGSIRNVAGKLTFENYYTFLYKECALMLTIDSAPLHIAKKLGLPTLSLWGPTNPINLSKSDERNKALYLAKPCSPCVHHTEILPCAGNNICMKEFEVDVIFNAFKNLIHDIQSTQKK